MGLVVKEPEGGNYEPIPEGVHIGVCIGVYDLGEHYSQAYNNNAKKLLVQWELPDVCDTENNKPRLISRRYTSSLHEKSQLRKDLQAWRGKAFTPKELAGFDVSNLLGKACQMQITHHIEGAKTYSRITALMSLSKGMQPPRATYPTIVFDLDQVDSFDKLRTLPEWIQKSIKESITYKSMISSNASGLPDFNSLPDDDDLPF